MPDASACLLSAALANRERPMGDGIRGVRLDGMDAFAPGVVGRWINNGSGHGTLSPRGTF